MRHTPSSIEPRWLLTAVFFIAGVFTGAMSLYLYRTSAETLRAQLQSSTTEYTYVNPSAVNESRSTTEFAPVNTELKLQVEDIISRAKASGDLKTAAVYFEDLSSKNILDENASTSFIPGTFPEIPIVMTYYKLAESNPNILNQRISFTTPAPPQEDMFESGDQIAIGRSYTVEDLITRTVAKSDDAAAVLLFREVDKNALGQAFADLGIDFVADAIGHDPITLRRYSLFFKMLYNASYLTPERSEKLLELLAQNPSHSLLKESVPHAIPFVSRIGGRKLSVQTSPLVEEYECDVVYYPQHHYLLCALAQAKSTAAVDTFFGLIGSATYGNVAYQYGT